MKTTRLTKLLFWSTFACGLLATTPAFAEDSPRYPFPANLTYVSGSIKPTNHTQAELNDDVSAFYTYWENSYVVAAGNDEHGHPMSRVTFGSEDPDNTVSEGQGYGMVIVPLMAGFDPDAQATFDKLLYFALAHPSEIDNRLMAWEIPPSDGGSDSAFDGDADIAYGLLLADAQWGSNGPINYAALARTRIEAIMASTIGPQSRLPMLGDWVEPNANKYNQDTPRSSDFMPGHFRAWERFTKNPAWNTVIANSASVINSIQANYSPGTGLLPDFIQDARTAPSPVPPYPPKFLEGRYDADFYYNAGRDPWRLGVDALLNGDPASFTQAHKMSDWARVQTGGDPEALRSGYQLDGSDLPNDEGDYFTSFFGSPMAVAAMLDPNHPEWLNSLYDAVRTDHEDYFEDSVNLMCLLVVSGNFWDPNLPPAPPHITRQPRSLVTRTDRLVRFTVMATGVAPLHYQWYQNGDLISGATTSTLTLDSVSASNNGTYTVIITAANGKSTTSGPATLSVN
jgi:hypothetical protein